MMYSSRVWNYPCFKVVLSDISFADDAGLTGMDKTNEGCGRHMKSSVSICGAQKFWGYAELPNIPELLISSL